MALLGCLRVTGCVIVGITHALKCQVPMKLVRTPKTLGLA